MINRTWTPEELDKIWPWSDERKEEGWRWHVDLNGNAFAFNHDLEVAVDVGLDGHVVALKRCDEPVTVHGEVVAAVWGASLGHDSPEAMAEHCEIEARNAVSAVQDSTSARYWNEAYGQAAAYDACAAMFRRGRTQTGATDIK